MVDIYAIGIVLGQNMFSKLKVYMYHRVPVLLIFGIKFGKNVQNILFK